MDIVVLVSGGGTNLQAIIDASLKNVNIKMVISSKDNVYALKRCEIHNLNSVVLPRSEFSDSNSYNLALLQLLKELEPDLIVLAGFMTVLSKDITDFYENRIINVHPSLIPSFCGDGFYGLKVHKAALDYGVKVTGATVHFVNSVVDGGKIILQKAVDVQDDDTPESLQKRVMEQAEWQILPEAIKLLEETLR